MIFFDCTKELNNKSDLYKFMNSTLQNLYKQLKFQKIKKDNLISLTDRLSNIDIENSSDINTTSLLSIIEELKTCLDNIRTNIEDINKQIKDLKKAIDSIDNPNNLNPEINLSLFYTLFIEKQNVMIERDMKTDALFRKVYLFINSSNLHSSIDSSLTSELSHYISNENKQNVQPSDADKKVPEINEKVNLDKNIEFDSQKINNTSNAANNVNSSVPDYDSNIEKQPIENHSQNVAQILEDNNILTISETQNKVFLPYKISDLKSKLNEKPKKYSSMEDLINKEYVLPLAKFKNANLSRFKEAYSLMRNREKASLGRCIDLALELTFESNLNPAIIAACKNLDELDNYLDCLDDMTPDKFNIFKIIYEIPPTVQA